MKYAIYDHLNNRFSGGLYGTRDEAEGMLRMYCPLGMVVEVGFREVEDTDMDDDDWDEDDEDAYAGGGWADEDDDEDEGDYYDGSLAYRQRFVGDDEDDTDMEELYDGGPAGGFARGGYVPSGFQEVARPTALSFMDDDDDDTDMDDGPRAGFAGQRVNSGSSWGRNCYAGW